MAEAMMKTILTMKAAVMRDRLHHGMGPNTLLRTTSSGLEFGSQQANPRPELADPDFEGLVGYPVPGL